MTAPPDDCLAPDEWICGAHLSSRREILAGLRAVPEETRQAARGLGHGPFRLLLAADPLLLGAQRLLTPLDPGAVR